MIRVQLSSQPIAAVQRSGALLATMQLSSLPQATVTRSARPIGRISVPRFPTASGDISGLIDELGAWLVDETGTVLTW